MESKASHELPQLPAGSKLWSEGDILRVQITGTMDVVEMQVLNDLSEAHFVEWGYVLLLVDATHTRSITPAARRLQSDRLQHVLRPSYTAVFGANTTLRLLSNLVQRGLLLLTKRTYAVSFHKGEAEGREVLATQRTVLQRKAGRVPV